MTIGTAAALGGLAVLAAVLALGGVAQGKTVPATTTTIDTRACQGQYVSLPFCNAKLSLDARVEDLIQRLEDAEIPPLLTAREGGGGSPGPPGNISRLGLPEYDFGTNCIHGVQSSCVLVDGKTVCPTSFPNPVNYGATWNSSLFHDLGRIIGDELRALWLLGATEESSWSGRPHIGLDCWSPNININRDPRWGRNQEVPSEDPMLNGDFGTLYTQGLQEGEDPAHLKAVVTLKHWDAYSLENSDGYTRHNFNAVVSNFTLQDTFFPAFKASVQKGKALGVMCSYNSLNGVPTCANSFLNNVLRTTWGFEGYISSDTGAVADIYAEHKYTKDEPSAAGAAISNGCDVDSGKIYHDLLLDAVGKGYCSKADVNTALKRTLGLRFKLGLFDDPTNQPYWHVPASAINATASQENNQLATLESMVLLKNEGKSLPFPTGKRVAVIGPHGNAQAALVGNYLGQICPDDSFDCVVSIEAALSALNAGGNVTFTPGCKLDASDKDDLAAAVANAKQADLVVLALGIGESIESESHDRTSIDLPQAQHELAAAIAAIGKPTTLVLINGGMVAVAAEQGSANIQSILSAGYPGVYGGVAVARTIFGQNPHLGGKLAYTVYPADYVNEVKMSDMEMTAGPGRSYRYYTGTPLWPFGFGLAFTTFTHQNVTALTPAAFDTGAAIDTAYSVKVTNTGSVTGDDVVQAYLKPKALVTDHPLIKQLVGYQRVHLAPGQSITVTIPVTTASLKLAEPATGNLVLIPGQYDLVLGNGVDEWVTFPIALGGPQRLVEPFPQF